MDKKKILIVSRSFYPVIAPRAFRATELAKELVRQGHDVTVLTHKHDCDYSEFSNNYNIVIKDFVFGKWREIKRNNVISKFFRVFLRYLFLYPDIQLVLLIKKALKKEFGYDLLISIAFPYPVHWGVALANSKSLTKVWVADCGDPFLGYGHKSGLPFYLNFIDDWFMKKVQILTIPYDELKKYYKDKYHDKIKLIPQGFDFNEIKLAEYQNNPVPTFAYAGIFIKNFRDPRLFLKYLSSLKLDFKFIVYTNSNDLLLEFRDQLQNKLEIRKYVPRTDLLFELSKMDFLINIQNGNKKDYPSKLIDYSLTKRPVLNINSFKLDESAINAFFNSDYSKNIAYKDIEKFNITNVARQFLSCLEVNE